MGKRLGQHFLKDKAATRKIVEALECNDGDIVIEIGPGHGELTEELISKNKKVRIIGIEKDGGLVKELRSIYPVGDKAEKIREGINRGRRTVETIEGDALKILPSLILDSSFLPRGYKVLGNIPYYITGYLLRTLGKLDKKPKLIVLTVQKEVAERLCAEPPRMNLLAASVQLWADTEIVGIVKKSSFKPQPKVDSAVVKLTTRNLRLTTQETEDYYNFAKALFKQPRKVIPNNIGAQYALSKAAIVQTLIKHGVDPQTRPATLSIEKIIELSSAFNE